VYTFRICFFSAFSSLILVFSFFLLLPVQTFEVLQLLVAFFGYSFSGVLGWGGRYLECFSQCIAVAVCSFTVGTVHND